MSSKTTSKSTSNANKVRLAGAAGLVAAALLVLTTLLTRVAPVGAEYESATDQLQQVVLVLTYALVLITLMGLHARQRASRRYERLGTLGNFLTIFGYGVILVVVVAGIVSGARVLNEVRLAGALVLLVGSVLLGAATVRARVVPWWCGVLLIVAFPLGHVANQTNAGAEALIFAMLWGSVGAALLQPSRSVSEASDISGRRRRRYEEC